MSWGASTWAWIGGIALVVIVLALVLTSGDGTRTAQQGAEPPARTAPPPATTPAPTPPPVTKQ
jgi:hypothetical protein